MLKDFSKSLSIYGILPLIGKFLGFFFIPIYIRIFNKTDYAAIELLLSSTSFITYLISLEIYTAVGRLFNEKNDDEKRLLVSTGFWLTIITSIIVILFCLIFKEQILILIFGEYKYEYEYYFMLIWVLLDAYLSYFSVVTRYNNRAKKFVLINISSLIIRFVSTLIFVISLNTGIIGVIYGHILGSLIGFIFFYIDNKKYLIFKIAKIDLKQILLYSLPMVPALLIFGVIEPLIRITTLELLSSNELADYSFAFRLASGFTIISFAVQNAYKPYIFEKIKTDTYKTSIIKISSFFEHLIYLGGCIYVLFGNEIINILGTEKYIDSLNIFGLIVWSQILSILIKFRELGPEISKKTKYLSYISIGSVLILISSLHLFGNLFGLMGVGIAIVLFQLSKYVSQTFLSFKLLGIRYPLLDEFKFFTILIICIILGFLGLNVLIKLILSAVLILFLSPKEIRAKYFCQIH